MSDELDRLLKESLKSTGDAYERQRSPQSRNEARQEFLTRYKRRRWQFPFAVAVAASGLAAIVTVGVYAIVDAPPDASRRERDTGIAGEDSPVVVFPIDGDPVDIGARDTGLWVADAADGELARFDPATGDPVASIPVGLPSALSIGVGSVWVGDPTDGVLYQVNKKTNTIVGGPVDVGDPSPSMSISVGDFAVWVVVDGQLKMVDLDTQEVTRVEGVEQPIDVAANLGMVWVLDGAEGLVRLDPTTGARTADPIPVRGFTGAVHAGAEGIWVADRGDDTIVSVEPDTGQTLAVAQVRGTYLDLGFDQSAVWVLSRAEGSSGYLTPLDLITGTPLSDPLKLEGQPVDVATGAGSVWVALREKGAVAKVDPIPLLEESDPTATP